MSFNRLVIVPIAIKYSIVIGKKTLSPSVKKWQAPERCLDVDKEKWTKISRVYAELVHFCGVWGHRVVTSAVPYIPCHYCDLTTFEVIFLEFSSPSPPYPLADEVKPACIRNNAQYAKQPHRNLVDTELYFAHRLCVEVPSY